MSTTLNDSTEYRKTQCRNIVFGFDMVIFNKKIVIYSSRITLSSPINLLLNSRVARKILRTKNIGIEKI